MIKICSVVKLHKRSWLLLIWCQKTASAIKYIGDKTVSLNVAAFTPPYVDHGQVGSRFGPPKNFGVTPPIDNSLSVNSFKMKLKTYDFGQRRRGVFSESVVVIRVSSLAYLLCYYSPCYSPCVASPARKPTGEARAWRISQWRSPSLYYIESTYSSPGKALGCVFRTRTFERNNLWLVYLARWFNLTLSSPKSSD